MMIALFILGGLIALAAGGELLVRGAVQLAERIGVSPLLISLTLVGLGTSTPEIVTSVQAALIGSPGIAVGNIVGSNIVNILLILGVSALIKPIVVSSLALRRDGVLVAATAVLFAAMSWLWTLDRAVGLVFITGLIVYIAYALRQERAGADGRTAAFERAEAFEAIHTGTHLHSTQSAKARTTSFVLSLGSALVGLVLVVVGGRFLVDGAIGIARILEISESVIGLTIVAVGTSAPEMVTSITAALRRQSDVALGNVLGSNIYNILAIGGLTALIAPTDVPLDIVRFDNIVMVAVSAAFLIFAWTGSRIGRKEGAVLVIGYGAYLLAEWW
jgi:cation:H+ antiporter